MKKQALAILCAMSVTFAGTAGHAEMSGSQYRISATVAATSGAPMGSAHFDTNGTLGQPDALSRHGLDPYSNVRTLKTGFWNTVADDGACSGDLNGDGDVDGSDLVQYLQGAGGTALGLFAMDFGKESCAADPPGMVLYNAVAYTMENDFETVEAVFIRNGKIAAVGTSAEMLAMAGPATVRIDLSGRAVFPGFIDPHTHLFNENGSQGLNLDHAQQLALECGVTTVANMYNDPASTEALRQYGLEGGMRVRLCLYLNYNHSCGGVFGTWYEAYPPRAEIAPNIRVNGVKVMEEESVCEQVYPMPVFSPELMASFTEQGLERWADTELHLSLEELTDVIREADDHGYQVAIHAMGDVGIETTMSAIEAVAGGSGNPNRHMIQHNYFIRDDMMDRYAAGNIVALVEPTSPCQANSYVSRVGEPNRRLFKRWRDLLATGAHVGMDSDWPFFGLTSVDPMQKLYAVVTGNNGFDNYTEPCEPLITDQTLTVLQGLKMMTTEAAYALRMETQIGSIQPGKLADLVVLSADPFLVAPDDIEAIRALLTVVGGRIEYRSGDLP